jgi:hypothetical protein
MAKKSNFFISLISEKNENGEYSNMSIGRVAFWMTFGLAMYKWAVTSSDITAAHTQMLYITATYNILKKTVLFNGGQITQKK